MKATVYCLPRTGDCALKFNGNAIVSVSSRRTNDRENSRWHKITLYQTTLKNYILAIDYQSKWIGEPEVNDVFVAPTLDSLPELLKRYDPTKYLVGYPPGEHFAEKQNRLKTLLEANYKQIVSELLKEIQVVETL